MNTLTTDTEDMDDKDPQKVAALLIRILDADHTRIMRRLLLLNMEAIENKIEHDPIARERFAVAWHADARDAVRSFFAYVEGTVYSLKQYAAIQLEMYERPLAPHEMDAVIECSHTMNEKGVLKDKPMNLSLFPNLLFMIRLQERLHKLPPQLDKNEPWWAALQESVRLRNRLMHPKHPDEMNIQTEDIKTLMLVRRGFNELLGRFLGPRPWQLPDAWKLRPELIPDSWVKDVNALQGLDEDGNSLQH